MMKFKTCILIIALLAFFGCGKEDPCESVSCLNGTCANGVCNCVPGYTGSDCSQQVKPIRINIQKIKVIDFPITDAGGSSWDLTNGADIYVSLALNGVVIADNKDSKILNVTDLPVTWNSLPTTFEMDEVTNQYTLGLFDADDFDTDDYISGVNFTPYSSNNGFPKTYLLECSGCPTIELTFDYDF